MSQTILKLILAVGQNPEAGAVLLDTSFLHRGTYNHVSYQGAAIFLGEAESFAKILKALVFFRNALLEMNVLGSFFFF